MSVLDRRNTEVGIIEGLFIRRTLQEQAKGIMQDSKRAMKGFKSAKWNNRSTDVSSDTLTYTQIAPFRFVDMKTRNSSSGYNPGTKKMKAGKIKKKNFPIHNKPIFTHKRFIVRTLSFGFTEEIKNQYRELAKINNLLPENK